MTTEELAKLSPEEKRVRIAEAHIPGLTGPYGCYNAPQLSGRVNGEEWILPDYLSSLDAMHEAEKTLIGAPRLTDYITNLRKVVDLEWEAAGTLNDYQAYACATATQRADAFLLTI